MIPLEFGLDVPATYTGGSKTVPYPDWYWNYQQTGANLGYANLNATSSSQCVYSASQSNCSVIADVISTTYGKLVSATGAKEGFYVQCLSYLPNPLVYQTSTLWFNLANHQWEYLAGDSPDVGADCNQAPTITVAVNSSGVLE